ncbi:MAG: lysine--tRNA ligase, partial [Pseudomonadota bacterium]
VPASDMEVSFGMLLNLASAAGAETKDVLWGFIQKYADVAPETHPGLDAAVGRALRYYQDRVKPAKVYRSPTKLEAEALSDLAARLRAWDGDTDAETLQTLIFSVGKDHGFEPLRLWFQAIYEVLIGASQGPRFGVFVALYGTTETADLIETALARSSDAA